nr:hypothetical protein [Tanacetum cinerariifolium]
RHAGRVSAHAARHCAGAGQLRAFLVAGAAGAGHGGGLLRGVYGPQPAGD